MTVLAAVYQPGPPLLDFVASLHDAAPGVRLVVVDDGSDRARRHLFDEVRDRGCTVLEHSANRGKGAALKTGLRHIMSAHPGHDVVCADPDGQHRVEDVLRVAGHVRATGRIVLGVRRFDGAVPLRSRIGNVLTRRLFHAATGQLVRDTQTGLRGCPAALLGWLTGVPGERFEYEMNVLLCAARAGHPIEEVVIATSYLDDNASSHFGSLSDSARIYVPLLRFAASSLFTRGSRQ